MKTKFLCSIALLLNFSLFAQWTEIATVDTNNLYSIYSHSNRLFIGGERGALYQTESNSNILVEKKLQPEGFIESTKFMNENIGFAGGGCWFPFQECPANTIYKTIDGGLNWESTIPDGGTGIFHEIEILENNRIFILSNLDGVRKSEDQGETWELVIVDEPLNAYQTLQFLNNEIGYITTAASGIVKLHKTTDGGANWEIVQSFEADGFGKTASFVNPEVAYAYHQNLFYKTEDGGVNWESSPFASDEIYSRNFFVVNENVIYISASPIGSNDGMLYKSTDAGQSWTLDYEGGLIGGLYFTDEENGYAILETHTILERSGEDAVNPIFSDMQFDIFPNPCNKQFSVQTNIESGSIEISTLLGQKIGIFKINGSNTPISVANFPSGTYFLKLFDSKGNFLNTEKLIIQD